MSTSAVLTILSLFSAHVLAQVNAPPCTVSSLAWTFNSLGQNPCTVSAYLLSTCYGGSFNLQALPQGYTYAGPTSDDNTTCKCSTVVYSLLSACDACQGESWFDWYQYSPECTNGMPAASFPHPVPGGIRVPHWALIDITIEGNWDYTQSFTVGDTPEVLPGAMINGVLTSTSSVFPSSTAMASTPSSISSSKPTISSTSTSSSSSEGSSSNGGAIAGGVVGGVSAVSAAILILLFFWRRSRAEQGPPANETFMPTTPTTPMNLHHQNDPTTFPGYQGTVPAPEAYTEVPNVYGGNTLTSTQTSRPLGYHGLPTV